MKKKFLVTAAVYALSAACIFGATACNKGDGSSGSNVPDVGPSIQVNAEEWRAAYEKTMSATNFTYVWVTTISDMEGYSETVKCYFWENMKFGETKAYMYGTYMGGMCEYSYTENGQSYIADDEDGEWGGYDGYFSFDLNKNSIFANDFNGGKNIGELYSEFTFNGGKYTANLINFNGVLPITVKIGENGYISYVYFEWNGGDDESSKEICEFTFYDFGTTEFNSVPSAAKRAIEDYKAANN